MTAAAVLDLSPGAGLVLDGTEWTVERREPHLGRVQLVKDDGTRERMTFRFLANHPQCRSSSRTSSAGADRGRQRKASEELNAGRLELTELRMAHLLEVATGFRSGDPFHPGPGEPRAEYDPTTTLTERRHAKVAELAALDPQHARLLGLGSVGYRTKDLAERHLGFLPDTTPKMRRRAASVFLVRRARGGGLDKAAQFLGINPENKRLGYTQLLNRRLRTSGMARDFEQALDAITAELLEGSTIDYQHRREALATWALEPENWRRMLTRLPDLTSHRKPLSDDRRRLAVSAYIWTRVTEGEPDFAPCPPLIAPDPALRAVWTRERHNVFHWLRTTDHQPYYGALKPLLEQHAEQLAKAIDDHPQRRR